MINPKSNHLLLTCLFALLLTSSLAQNKFITAYNFDFSGISREFGVGRYTNMDLIRAGLGSVKSLKVPAGMKVTLYEKANFDGYSLVVTDDASMQFLQAKKFGESGLSISMVVEEYTPPAGTLFVTIYKDDFAGPSKNLAIGQYEFNELGPVDNDHLSSIKIPKGLKVTLYEHGGFGGRKLELTKDTRAGTLVNNNFNDLTSSIEVEELPAPPVVTTPATTPTPATAPTTTPVQTTSPVITEKPSAPVIATLPVAEPTEPIIYQGDFSGESKVLIPGRYSSAELGIGNDQLSSIKVPRGFKVTLYADDAFEGSYLVVTQDTRASAFADINFNNVTSSILVERVPMVTIYTDDYSGSSKNFDVGKYSGSDLGIGVKQLSSIRIPKGLRVTLFAQDAFEGRMLVLTQDSGNDIIKDNGFDNLTSSLVIERIETTEPPMVTLFDDDYSGTSKRLGTGSYEHTQMGIGNNALSSIRIPRGLQVTMYEYGAMEGRSAVLRADAGKDFFVAHDFDNLASSIRIEQLPASDLMVTVATASFSKNFAPGRYRASDLAMLYKNPLTAIKVPQGMRAIVHADPEFMGTSVTFERDKDLTNFSLFNGKQFSLIIQDIFEPIVTPTSKPAPVQNPVVVEAPVVQQPVEIVPTAPPCEMTAQQFQNAVKAVADRPFRDDKMEMAKIVTKGKCLTNEQIKGIATRFSFEDQTLEFVKYAYDLSSEKADYYTLGDLFKFMSSKDDFAEFLKGK